MNTLTLIAKSKYSTSTRVSMKILNTKTLDLLVCLSLKIEPKKAQLSFCTPSPLKSGEMGVFQCCVDHCSSPNICISQIFWHCQREQYIKNNEKKTALQKHCCKKCRE